MATAASRSAPDKLRKLVQRHQHSAEDARRRRNLDPAKELRTIRGLLAQGTRLIDRSRPGENSLANARDTVAKLADAVRTKDVFTDSKVGAAYYTLRKLQLRPAFKVGESTPRGRVENVREYSSDGYLYDVRNDRGVREPVWESTLVWRGPSRDPQHRVGRDKSTFDSTREARVFQRTLSDSGFPGAIVGEDRSGAFVLYPSHVPGTAVREARSNAARVRRHLGGAPLSERDARKPTRAQQRFISDKIRVLREEGYPEKQAIAVAYRMAGVPPRASRGRVRRRTARRTR